MAKKKRPPKKATRARKSTRAALRKAVGSEHANLTEAVHAVLRKAGLPAELTLHSIRLSIAHGALSGPGCNPPCRADQDCVLDSNGGEVRWVCIPRAG
jgi:hypothetical protein